MNIQQKTNYLKENHLDEWLSTYTQVEMELSDKQTMLCVCGKLATGLHESRCKKFNDKIKAAVVLRLKNLLEKELG